MYQNHMMENMSWITLRYELSKGSLQKVGVIQALIGKRDPVDSAAYVRILTGCDAAYLQDK